MEKENPVARAMDAVGGPSRLAELLGVTQQVVTNWRARGVPVGWCLAIERVTDGVVTRRDLRADWRDIWPDLERRKSAKA